MPFPTDPFSFTGGCNCKAVRYRVTLPEWSERALCPYKSAGADIGGIRMPVSMICHCNDCRSATTALGLAAVCLEATTIEFSSAYKAANAEVSEGGEKWSRSGEEFSTNPELAESAPIWLTRYASSPARNRWFCARCGTPVAYTIDRDALPQGMPTMVDIYTGTVDRELLELELFKPDHILWTAVGIPWVRSQVKEGAGAPEHPFIHIDKKMGDDVSAVVKALHAAGKNINVTIPE